MGAVLVVVTRSVLVWPLAVACTTGGQVLTETRTTEPARDAGSMDARSSDPPDAGGVVGFQHLSLAAEHTCATRGDLVLCAGSNASGELGTSGDLAARLLPSSLRGRNARHLAAGYSFTCVLRESGEVECTGANDMGQLGAGDLEVSASPRTTALPEAARYLDAKFSAACAIGESGSVYCWGWNDDGQLAEFVEDPPVVTPIRVVSDPVGFVSVSIGRSQAYAIATDGGLYCWGDNGAGEVGIGPGTPGEFTDPMRIDSNAYAQVASGQNHTCAITRSGALYCWGIILDNDGHPGPMGHDDGLVHDQPAQVGTESDWTQIATDTFHSCGLRAEGELWCWGRNAEGQLGVGSQGVVEGRVHVAPESRFQRVAVGRFHTCALRSDGELLCTGKNDNGELAVGDRERRSTLTPVVY